MITGRLLLVFVCVVLLSPEALAQSRRPRNARPAPASTPAAPRPPAIQGPEYIGTIEAVVDGRRTDLERVRVENKGSVRLMGLGGVSVYLQAPGDHSPIRVPRGSTIEFVTRVATQEIDPLEMVTLYRTDTRKKGWRRVKIARAGMGGMADKTSAQLVALTGGKYGPNFYKLRPLGPLEPGEYLVTAGSGGTTGTGFMFGVD